MTATLEVDEPDPTDGEHMYEDVYNMNHRQAKPDQHSDKIHTYYNELVPTAKVNNANKNDKQKENIKNGASKKRKQQLAKEKKSKERKGKKSKPDKAASKDDDTDAYYNVIGRCDRNEVGHVGSGNDCDKQNPGRSVNVSKKPDEKYSDDDISYTDEPCKIEDLYSKPHKAKKDHVSTSQKPDDKAESTKKNTITPPQAACSKKQHENGNEKGSKLQDATMGQADNASCVRGNNEKTKIRREESEEHDTASAEEQSRTADSTSGKTHNKVKDPVLSKDPAAKSMDTPGRNKIGMAANGEVPPSKPPVHPKPSVIPPSLAPILPTTKNAKEDEYAYVTVPKDMKIVLDTAQSDIIVHDEGNDDADCDDMNSSDEDISYVTLGHIEGDNEEYDIEDQDNYDDDEVAYAAIRTPDKPTMPNTTGEDVTVYVDNDLYSSYKM